MRKKYGNSRKPGSTTRYNVTMSTFTQRILSSFATIAMSTVLYAATKPVTVQLKDAKGQSAGTAVIASAKTGKGVTIKLNVMNLTPGEHALHIHTAAKCEGPGFTTAGPHFNPAQKKHGL